MDEEEIKKKMLVLQVLVGIQMKTMGDMVTHMSEIMSSYSTSGLGLQHVLEDEEHAKKIAHFKKSQEAYDANTAMAMGLMAKICPELIEQMFPVEH